MCQQSFNVIFETFEDYITVNQQKLELDSVDVRNYKQFFLNPTIFNVQITVKPL